MPLKYGKRPSGFAFVGYAAADAAQKAIDELNEKSKWITRYEIDQRLIKIAFGDRTVRLELARSKDEVTERRKARDERRAAAKATRHLEQSQKTVDEGGVVGEEGESKPKKKRAPVSLPFVPYNTQLIVQRRRQPAEGDEEVEGEAANGDGETAAKPKRKPRNRKPKTTEARIDGGEETEGAAEGAEKPKKAKKAKKPRQPKLELTGEQSKVCLSLLYPAGILR